MRLFKLIPFTLLIAGKDAFANAQLSCPADSIYMSTNELPTENQCIVINSEEINSVDRERMATLRRWWELAGMPESYRRSDVCEDMHHIIISYCLEAVLVMTSVRFLAPNIIKLSIYTIQYIINSISSTLIDIAYYLELRASGFTAKEIIEAYSSRGKKFSYSYIEWIKDNSLLLKKYVSALGSDSTESLTSLHALISHLEVLDNAVNSLCSKINLQPSWSETISYVDASHEIKKQIKKINDLVTMSRLNLNNNKYTELKFEALKPAIIIVLDKLQSSANKYEKHLLLYGLNNSRISLLRNYLNEYFYIHRYESLSKKHEVKKLESLNQRKSIRSMFNGGICSGDTSLVLNNPESILMTNADGANTYQKNRGLLSQMYHMNFHFNDGNKELVKSVIMYTKFCLDLTRTDDSVPKVSDTNNSVEHVFYFKTMLVGHSVSFAKILVNSKLKYFFRDCNTGIYEIDDFDKFSEFYYEYLKLIYRDIHFFSVRTIIPNDIKRHIELIANTTSVSNKLKYLGNNLFSPIKTTKIEELIKLAPNLIRHDNKVLFCLLSLQHVINGIFKPSDQCTELLDLILKASSSLKVDNDINTLINLALELVYCCKQLSDDNMPQATIHFTKFQEMISSTEGNNFMCGSFYNLALDLARYKDKFNALIMLTTPAENIGHAYVQLNNIQLLLSLSLYFLGELNINDPLQESLKLGNSQYTNSNVKPRKLYYTKPNMPLRFTTEKLFALRTIAEVDEEQELEPALVQKLASSCKLSAI